MLQRVQKQQYDAPQSVKTFKDQWADAACRKATLKFRNASNEWSRFDETRRLEEFGPKRGKYSRLINCILNGDKEKGIPALTITDPDIISGAVWKGALKEAIESNADNLRSHFASRPRNISYHNIDELMDLYKTACEQGGFPFIEVK